MTKPRFKFGISVATSVALILLGVLFTVSALDLYLTGGIRPYSRDRVSEYLFPLIPSAIITALLVVFGILLHIGEAAEGDGRAKRSPLERLRDFALKFKGVELPEDIASAVLSERRKRRAINIIFLSLSAVFFALAFLYVLFLAEFTVEELNHNVLIAFAVALPLFVISVGINIPRLYLLNRSAEAEHGVLKSAVTLGVKPIPRVSPRTVRGESFVKGVLCVSVLVLSVVFIFFGVSNGGMDSVFEKAIKICTECIGLG